MSQTPILLSSKAESALLSGPSPPIRFLTHRCTAEPVDPRLGGETSLIMMAAGALHISLSAKPTSNAAKDWLASGARMLQTRTGQAAIVAPVASTIDQASPILTFGKQMRNLWYSFQSKARSFGASSVRCSARFLLSSRHHCILLHSNLTSDNPRNLKVFEIGHGEVHRLLKAPDTQLLKYFDRSQRAMCKRKLRKWRWRDELKAPPEVKIRRPPFLDSQSPISPPPTPPRMPPTGRMPANAGAYTSGPSS